MAPIVPAAISHWPRAIIQDVAFMASNMEEEMNTYDMCAALRAEYPHHRYINPSDVTTIQEWLDAREEGYGGLKEGIRQSIATLGESKALRWRELVERALRIAKEKGWEGYDVFESEDPRPRGEIEEVVDQFGELAVGAEDAPSGGEAGGLREEEDVREEAAEAVEPNEVQGGWRILARADRRHEDVQGILEEMKAGAPDLEAAEGEQNDEVAAEE